MIIRRSKVQDAGNMLKMLLELDKETLYMLLEPGERNNDITRIETMIKGVIDSGGVQFVAIHNNEIIGFLTARREIPRKVRHSAYIVVGIREAHRGRGIGSKLFKELDKWAKANNVTRLELTVMEPNTLAKELYEKNGFKVEGIKKNSIFMDGKYIDEYYMGKVY